MASLRSPEHVNSNQLVLYSSSKFSVASHSSEFVIFHFCRFHLVYLLIFYDTLLCLYLHWQDKQQKMAEEQRNLVQQQSQAKAQMLRYEDELARKRMQVKGLIFYLLFATKVVYFGI